MEIQSNLCRMVVDAVQLRMDNQWDEIREKWAKLKQDTWIENYVVEIMQRVRHYLHLNELPDALISVLTSMTCDLIRCESQFDSQASSGLVQGWSLGDAQMTFASPDASIRNALDGIVRAYKSDLHYYRRMAH